MTQKEIHKVRTRFPPSPTGAIQMGNIRTALFNYLYAKAHKGDFILRIEDTDKERSSKEWEQEIFDSARWLGFTFKEGPEEGGPYAPYRQSERTDLYKKYLDRLLEQGSAYYCFCTKEELEAQHAHQASLGEAPHYIGTCRSLVKEQTQKQLTENMPSVIRFIVDLKTVTFQDMVRGEIKFDTGLLGDIVIAKDLKTPLYNFTVVVDDFEMQITHVIRGEDHIANTPKQILIQEALNLPGVQYAHVPLLLGEDRSKLSKRHGDMSVRKFREEGYLPEAILNFLALLGWNPGDEREIFSIDELIKEFSLERVQKGAAVFNIQRLDWINGHYIRNKSVEELTQLCLPYLPRAKEMNTDPKTLQAVIAMHQERLKKLSEITELTEFFFAESLEYDAELLQWKDASNNQTKAMFEKLDVLLAKTGGGDWTKERLEEILMPEAEKESNRGFMLWPLRVALSGKRASAGPFEIAAVLGKDKTLQRMADAKDKL